MTVSRQLTAWLGMTAGVLFWTQTAAAASIDSHEYKLMLVADRFDGADPASIIGDFLKAELVPLIDQILDPGRDPDDVGADDPTLKKERLVQFYDTPGCGLRQSGFVFRVRTKAPAGVRSNKKPEATLKFRSPDLAVAADQRFTGDDAKFEADISPATAATTADGQTPGAEAVRVQYSASKSDKFRASKRINKVDDVLDIFASAEQKLDPLDEDTPLALVSDFTAFERVYDLGKINLGGSTDAPVSITIWYDSEHDAFDRPEVVELSFAFDAPAEGEVDPEVTQRAMQLFAGLQGLDGWFDPASATKTAFAYHFRRFCEAA